MNYTRLLSRSYRLIRTHPTLWALGFIMALFGAGANTFSSLSDSGPRVVQAVPGLSSAFETLELGVVLVFVCLAIILVLVGLTVQYVSRVGLVDGTARAHWEEPVRLGEALRRGLSADALRLLLADIILFTPLFMLMIVLGVLLVVGLFGGIAALEEGRTFPGVLFFLFFIGALFVFLGLGMLVGGLATILVQWTARFVVIGGQGLLDGLGFAWRTFRAHWQESVILWVIHVGVQFLVQFLLSALFIALFFPVLIGLIGGALMELPPALLIVGGLLFGLLIWFIQAAVQGGVTAFLETLWTLGWFELQGTTASGGASGNE